VGDYINAAVSGQREGTRIVLREPADEQDGSRTTKITIVDLLPTTATGEAKEPAPGAPTVSEGTDGSITVSSAGLPAPTRASTSVLIKGTGPQIGPQNKLIARTTMVSWATGQPLEESTFGYQTPPKQLDMSNALVGVSQNLVDITVGSRVVLSLPAEQAQGNEPVVVVIDVLAIDSAKSSGSSEGKTGGTPAATPQASASPRPTTQDQS
jgi:FKBP-type peptidyl-prolyl cis-trans isomerase